MSLLKKAQRTGLLAGFLILLFVLGTSSVWGQSLPPAKDLLERSIVYHNPDNNWYKINHKILLASRRPDGSETTQTLLLSHGDAQFGFEMERDGKKIDAILELDGTCVTHINGSTEISEEDKKKYRLNCDQLEQSRDYYGYMLGLPMNLKDPGTILDPVAKRDKFQGEDVITLKVTYSEEVGADTWYFYLNPVTHALIGCRFYHDESKNDGEYLIFEDEVRVGKVVLPQKRKWYYNDDRGYLGEDEILKMP